MEAKRELVAVIMGSDSDLPTMRESTKILDKLGIGYVMRISSAHRAPKKTVDLAESLEKNGIEVVIVGAGLAAHLPGVIASLTALPVIGIPMEGGNLRGLDALYSIVQMPSGVPVATMSIGKHGAKNAAIMAAQILSLKYPEIDKRVRSMKKDLAQSVDDKDRELVAAEKAASDSRKVTVEGGR
jgi:5-(carboxyamino)imidazole ribonucleotide mutase